MIGRTGNNTEGVTVADFDGDGDFDAITGHAQSPYISLYFYEKQGDHFAPPVLIGTLGNTTTSAGNWLMDMAAADVNNDGAMDFVVNSTTTQSWLFLNQGALHFDQTTVLASDFESSTSPWSPVAGCKTGMARDASTAANSTASLHIFATGDNSCLAVETSPTGWHLAQGPTLSFAYRIPPGVPVGVWVNIAGVGRVVIAGSRTARLGTYPVLSATPLIDDDAWHTVTFDLYHAILPRWPTAGAVSAIQWFTDGNAPVSAQFWVDDVRITGRTYHAGFDSRPLPGTGDVGRGMDATDVDGDGNADLARAHYGDGRILLWRGDGAANFTTTVVADPGADPYGVVLADFDRDGAIDLIANNAATGDAFFYKGNGNGTFRAGLALPSLDTNDYAAYDAYDFNHDGHQDLSVVTWSGRQVWYYPGRGDGTFGPRALIGTATHHALGLAAPTGRVPGQPFTVATLDRPIGRVGDPLTFDASGSFDDGTLVSYAWNFGDGTTASGPVVTHAFQTEGVYTAVVTVTDDAGQRDRRSLRVTVQGAPPVARLSGPAVADERAASLGQWAVQVDLTGSADDAAVASYTVDWGDGSQTTFRPTDASGQSVISDQGQVTALAEALRPMHVYNTAGDYQITLTVTDRAAQRATAVHTTHVRASAPPVADPGGPYLLTEADAYAGKWEFVLDATRSTDDHGIQRYTVNFGDGTTYTTGMPDGKQTGAFAAGTDIYGYGLPNARGGHILATQDNTAVEVINLATGALLTAVKLHRFDTWEITPGTGIPFKVRATKPVLVLGTDFSSHTTFIPALDASPVGHEFVFRHYANSGFFVYAMADTMVRFFATDGSRVAEHVMRAGTYWRPAMLHNGLVYRAVATGKVAMQTTGPASYTTVPSATGDSVGRLFHFATTQGNTGAFLALAYAPTDVRVVDLDTGTLLYTKTLSQGESWFQSGVGTRRLRLESTGDVEVWAGDTTGGSGVSDLRDTIAVTTGREGKDFYVHMSQDGIVIFAPNGNTQVSVDNDAFTTTLQRDSFLRLTPADVPSGGGVHHIVASEPILLQTTGHAGRFTTEGTYLGGVSARHRYTAPGLYPLTLTVTDRAGQTHTATTTVEVRTGTPPVAHIDAPSVLDETAASAGRWTVTFDASGSQDDVGIIAYAWDFDDHTTGTGACPTHVYTTPGTYTVTLTVTDYAGQRTTTTTTVVVEENDPPVANAGGPYLVGEAAASRGLWTVTLDGRGSTDDVAVAEYQWVFEPALDEHFTGTTLDATRWFASPGAAQDHALTITGTGQWGNRYVFSRDEFARTAGAVFQARITPVDTSGLRAAMWGLKHRSADDLGHTGMPHAVYFNFGRIDVYEDGAPRDTIGSYQPGVAYDVRITLKTPGALYEVKRADASTWAFAYDSSYSQATPLKVGGTVYRIFPLGNEATH